jgi:hypothetical protein
MHAYRSKQSLEVDIDSIYVNEVEDLDTIKNLLEFAYYLTIKNNTDSAISFSLKDYNPDRIINTKCMFLFGLDTIHLHRATRSNLTALPKQKIHVGVANDSWDLIELFERYGYSFDDHNLVNGLNEVEFLKQIVKECKIRVEWRGLSAEAFVTKKTKINFRDPNLEIID